MISLTLDKNEMIHAKEYITPTFRLLFKQAI